MENPLTTSEMDLFMDITFLFSSVLDLKLLSGKFLQLLGKLIPYEKAVIFFYHEQQQRLILGTDLRCEKTLIADYLNKFHAMDYLGWLIYQKGIDIVRESDQIQQKDKEGSIFYREFLKKHGIEYRLLFHLESSVGKLLGAGMLFRSKLFTDFSDREKEIMQQLLQHLSAAIEHSIRFEQLTKSGTLAQKVYQDITDAMMVFNSNLEIKYSNQQSKRLMEVLSHTKGDYDDFMACIQTACHALINDHNSDNNVGMASDTMTVKVYYGTAKISMIPTNTIMAEGPHEFVVVYTDASQDHPITLEETMGESSKQNERYVKKYHRSFYSTLVTEYKLTKREVKLMQLALDGLENRDIAEQLYISLFTVKSHFQNGYSKLGIKNRQELYHLYMNYMLSEEFRQNFDTNTRKDEFW